LNKRSSKGGTINVFYYLFVYIDTYVYIMEGLYFELLPQR